VVAVFELNSLRKTINRRINKIANKADGPRISAELPILVVNPKFLNDEIIAKPPPVFAE
tara:strand:- start:486 stop:662 length:177 start_codon:yes stop_codon:yes gene_type:complete